MAAANKDEGEEIKFTKQVLIKANDIRWQEECY